MLGIFEVDRREVQQDLSCCASCYEPALCKRHHHSALGVTLTLIESSSGTSQKQLLNRSYGVVAVVLGQKGERTDVSALDCVLG